MGQHRRKEKLTANPCRGQITFGVRDLANHSRHLREPIHVDIVMVRFVLLQWFVIHISFAWGLSPDLAPNSGIP
jgi:hypothetical protein